MPVFGPLGLTYPPLQQLGNIYGGGQPNSPTGTVSFGGQPGGQPAFGLPSNNLPQHLPFANPQNMPPNTQPNIKTDLANPQGGFSGGQPPPQQPFQPPQLNQPKPPWGGAPWSGGAPNSASIWQNFNQQNPQGWFNQQNMPQFFQNWAQQNPNWQNQNWNWPGNNLGDLSG